MTDRNGNNGFDHRQNHTIASKTTIANAVPRRPVWEGRNQAIQRAADAQTAAVGDEAGVGAY